MQRKPKRCSKCGRPVYSDERAEGPDELCIACFYAEHREQRQ